MVPWRPFVKFTAIKQAKVEIQKLQQKRCINMEWRNVTIPWLKAGYQHISLNRFYTGLLHICGCNWFA